MSRGRVRIWPELPQAVIHPNVYGHFAEHLGRCIYEGVWVGPESAIPNEGGLRLDVLAALKQLRAPIVRWPGGCFADTYHWRYGVGSAETRPQTVNLWWRQGEPNSFGTNEFMRFCQTVGCSPYICLNVGSGTPKEALEWLEYCNFGGESALTRLRKKNGSPKPYGVKYWGVGNETGGCGGRFRPDDYAKEYVRFAAYLKAFDPTIELVACGYGACTDKADFQFWNHDFLKRGIPYDLIDHLSIHRYFSRGTATGFSDAEFLALFGDLLAMERDIEAADQLLGYFFPDKKVGLAIDEWGVWHPSAVIANGLEQESTLRDAVFAGACLNLFNRHAGRISMANLAQTVNVLHCVAATVGARMLLTPTYHVFDMMRPHMGARLLTHEVECDQFEAHPIGMSRKCSVPALSVSVSISGKRVFLTVANQTIHKDVEVCIELREARVAGAVGRSLNSDDPRDMNSFENPKKVVPRRTKIEVGQTELAHTFPAHSFTALAVTLE